MQMLDTGGEEKKLDMLESGKGKGVNDLDRVVVDHLVILVIQCETIYHCRRSPAWRCARSPRKRNPQWCGFCGVVYYYQQHQYQKIDFKMVRSVEF